MTVKLYSYQEDAVSRMKNGCILCGGVGSGKSLTSLAYYMQKIKNEKYPSDLYIITTARKRDTFEWDDEIKNYHLSRDPKKNQYSNHIFIDSWNDIQKYANVENSFFIFDEQRLIGNGVWVKTFLKIVKSNRWILLTATPGDTWIDYIPVFIANGFYKNRTEFTREHVIFSRWTKFPKVDRYVNTGKLIRYRNDILVDMDFNRKTVAHHEDILVDYDVILYKTVLSSHWNAEKKAPIRNAAELCYVLRKIVNADDNRIEQVKKILLEKKKAIIFYNFDYELELLKNGLDIPNLEIAEWNGHKHELLPTSDMWAYLVQYAAGCEGWNCTKTDTTIFYSQNYSYRVMVQASGRIDRLNTPYTDLYYYHLKSRAPIDTAIGFALSKKKKFNQSKFAEKYLEREIYNEKDSNKFEESIERKYKECR